MTDWLTFFRTLAVSSGTAARYTNGNVVPPLPYASVALLSDAGLNAEAFKSHMLPLPGGRGDIGMSELAEIHIKEESQ